MLAGLSKPVPFLSYEIIIGRQEDALECIRILTQLGQCRFNVSSNEALGFDYFSWMEPDEMKHKISQLKTSGNIYVNFL